MCNENESPDASKGHDIQRFSMIGANTLGSIFRFKLSQQLFSYFSEITKNNQTLIQVISPIPLQKF